MRQRDLAYAVLGASVLAAVGGLFGLIPFWTLPIVLSAVALGLVLKHTAGER